MPTRRALVADDDPNIRLTLSTVLEDLGFEVETAINGWEAVYAVRRPHDDGPFWLVLMDFAMPGMDGLEAINDIHEEFPDIHLAMISANASATVATDAVEYGAAVYLPKPFGPAEVRALVAELERRDAA